MTIEIKDIKLFQVECDRGYCNRGVEYTDNCLKNNKQIKCYSKYLKKQKKEISKQNIKIESGYILTQEKDIKWENVCREVDYRDCDCVVWNKVLTDFEKQYIFDKFSWELDKLSVLDHCHIISRSQDRSLIYDVNNIFLTKRFFHQRLDQYRDLVTGEKMDKDRRNWWLDKIKKVIGV